MSRAEAHADVSTRSWRAAFVFWAALVAMSVTVSAAEPTPKGIQMIAPAIPLPTTSFVNHAGTPTTLGSFTGKIVVLNVWATWCGPCIKEIPSLDRLAAKLDPSKAVVLAISQDKGGIAIAKPFLDNLGTKNLSAFADPSGKLSRDLAIRGLPTTFIVAQTGQIIGRVEGPLEWDSPDIVQYILSQPD
jgi:thiol-disulfide isomerase/thioredoxin